MIESMSVYNSTDKGIPRKLKLNGDEIHVWCASLTQPESRSQMLLETLSVEEQMRAKRFHFEKHRKYLVICHGILRTILGEYLGVEPARLNFCYGRNGKPELADTFANQKICFNISRSEGLALYGFTCDRELGVDIEYIRVLPEMDQIVERFFSVGEKSIFHALPRSKKKEAFFRCWTQKEAFLKANGYGLSRPLNTFDVSFVEGEPAKILRIEGDSKAASQWFIQDLKPANQFAAAFAAKGRNAQIHYWRWPNVQ